MAGKKRGPEDSFRKKPSRRKAGAKKTDGKISAAKVGGEEKVIARKSRQAKTAAKGVVNPKISTRKPVPIKTARVGKRAVLPPLPPPPAGPLKTTRSPARALRGKAPTRDKIARSRSTIAEIALCTEALLREKLRAAAPYVKIWMARIGDGDAEVDSSAPEAAFVRLWQWLNLETALDDGRIVTPELLNTLFSEEIGAPKV